MDETSILSSSPTSSTTPPEALSRKPKSKLQRDVVNQCLSLEEFVAALPTTIREEKSETVVPGDDGSTTDAIGDLFGRLALDKHEWERFAIFDPSKHYTRNLIATDGETFSLMLLCWNPGHASPVHNHPCDGCWMRLCEGSIQEQRYVQNAESDRLDCVSDNVFHESDRVYYITDSMGYHKVGNPNETVPAVTMHLYCPPFQSCKIWLDPDHTSKPRTSCVYYHSEYGRRV